MRSTIRLKYQNNKFLYFIKRAKFSESVEHRKACNQRKTEKGNKMKEILENWMTKRCKDSMVCEIEAITLSQDSSSLSRNRDKQQDGCDSIQLNSY